MAKSAIQVSGDLSKLRGLSGKVNGAVGQSVREISLDLLGESVRRAPVDEGTLRGSGTAHFSGGRIASGKDFDPTADGDEGATGGLGTTPTTAAVAFNTVYAEAQHEGVDYVHPKGGEAKYLERPLEENRKRYETRIARAAKKALS